jgi:hypothetical protein
MFLNPSFLWALLGLGIPVAIHLWSKKQGKRIKVGSIKYLQTSDSQKSRHLKLNELVLLLLRMLLTAILVFIIAEPRLTYPSEKTTLTYIVEASLLDSPVIKKRMDSLSLDADVRLLQTEFPSYPSELQEYKNLSQINYWQLAERMQDLNTDSIVVFTNAYLKNVKGKRPKINKNIHWVNLNKSENTTQVAGILNNRNKKEIVSVVSNANRLRFQKELTASDLEVGDSIPIIEKDTIQIKIFADESLALESKFIQASFSAIAIYLDHPIKMSYLKPSDRMVKADALVWLSESSAPQTEGKILKFREDPLANTLVTKGDSIQEFYLNTRLNTENIIEQHLGMQLMGFLDFYPEIQHLSENYDQRIIDINQLQPSLTEDSSLKARQEKKDLSIYLGLIFLILILTERYISKLRKQ